jgi:signal transduction histidine kinase
MITISVVDDGIGLADSVRRGRGLNNMQRRAREVGGDLSIIRGPVGTQVCLRLKEEVWLGDYPDPSR